MVVDHNHETGEVRGLLCAKDNLLLGTARESTVYLARAIQYLALFGHYAKPADLERPETNMEERAADVASVLQSK